VTASDRIRFGLALFGHAPEEHVPLAVYAEELGLRDLWIGEHVVAPIIQRPGLYHEADIVRDDTELADIWTVCGAVAGATKHLWVSPGVLIAPLRHPLATALAASTTCRVSGGRFRLGLGAGWLEEEFQYLGAEFGSRFKRLDEIVEVVRLLARGGAHAFHGQFYDFEASRTTHTPVGFPVILGGLTDAALRRAARLGDGWYGVPGIEIDRLVEVREVVKRARGGIDEFTFHVRLSQGFDRADVDLLVDNGFNHVIVPWEALWSSRERRTLPLDAKLARLHAAARLLGLTT
jgi:alkanesulfonate monooxygenase SsuD/methylene tetrahydromethanopterin reductase-like flavin-dependent oxidoreductase (luciferase family)